MDHANIDLLRRRKRSTLDSVRSIVKTRTLATGNFLKMFTIEANRTKSLSLVLVLILGTALICQAQVPKELTDEEVLNIIYSSPRFSGPKVPTGFYTEPLSKNNDVTISVSWVRRQKNRSSDYFPVHAADAGEARKLTQEFLDNANLPAEAKKIVRPQVTPRFFQFDTEHKIGDRRYILRLRVWRSDF